MTDTPAIEGGDPIRDSTLGYGGQVVGEAEKEAVIDVLDSDYITRGPVVEAFETAVADFVDTEHAIAVTSGTAALHLVGAALGLDEGDEVITTPFTFCSTAHTASYQGATPVFADIDPRTRNLDPARVRERITPDTEVILPMHYAGQPAAIDEIQDIATDHGLDVVWDSCHALGSEWRGRPVGGQSDAATFSFHPVKNITTGEGGMVVTDDDQLAERVRSLRSFDMQYEWPNRDDEPWFQAVRGLGYNYNFTDIQAAIGLAQLDRIDSFKRRRDQIIEQYEQAFASVPGLETPFVTDDCDPMWHLYAVEIGEKFGCSRRRFVNAMHAENIGVQVHYVPLHYHPYFQTEYGYEVGDYPVAESVYEHIVSLPLTPAMSDDDVDDVLSAVERIRSYYS